VRLAFAIDPPVFYGGTSANAREVGDIFHAGLTYFDSKDTLLPKVAVKVPSISDGDWRTSADGTMEVTWKLKPGLTWHDGTPLTSEDFAFAIRMFKEPGSTFVVPRGISFVGEVAAPDAETLVLRYPRIFNGAAVAGSADLPPVPRHLLEEQFAQVGAAGVTNLSFWGNEWVGLGPFKLTSRVLGSHIEAEAFDGFVFGRPQIDRLVMRPFAEINAMVTSVLAGDVDMVPDGALNPEHADTLKQQWESAGKGSVGIVLVRARQYQLQYRDPAAPWAGDVRVRQAMMHLIDRQGIVDSIYYGLSAVAEMGPPPSHPVYAIVERRGLPKHGLNRTEAERLLDAAGWPRGADGVRRNAAGTVFTHNPATVAENLDELLVIVEGFRAGGINSTPDIIQDAAVATNSNELRSIAHSNGRSAAADDSFWDRFRASEISSAARRWSGANNGGYVNPVVDRMFEQWVVTLDPNARLEREADFYKLLADEVAYMPIIYDLEIFAHRRGLVGPQPFSFLGRNTTSNVHTWTLD